MSKPVVVLTGASKGIGLAVTRSLLEEHSAFVVAISRSRTKEIANLCEKYSSSLLFIECDVTDETQLSKIITETVEKYKRIDGLILNAGTLEPLGRIDSPATTLDAWKSHFDVNFFSLITALKAALPSLRKSTLGGRVVFLSSGAATGSIPGWGPYNAGKAAMNGLSRTLAKEEPNIVSIALSPGKVDTDMQAVLRSAGAHMTKEDHEMFVNAHKDGQLVNPRDVGYVIASLSLHAPLSMSGQFVRWDADACDDFRRK